MAAVAGMADPRYWTPEEREQHVRFIVEKLLNLASQFASTPFFTSIESRLKAQLLTAPRMSDVEIHNFTWLPEHTVCSLFHRDIYDVFLMSNTWYPSVKQMFCSTPHGTRMFRVVAMIQTCLMMFLYGYPDTYDHFVWAMALSLYPDAFVRPDKGQFARITEMSNAIPLHFTTDQFLISCESWNDPEAPHEEYPYIEHMRSWIAGYQEPEPHVFTCMLSLIKEYQSVVQTTFQNCWGDTSLWEVAEIPEGQPGPDAKRLCFRGAAPGFEFLFFTHPERNPMLLLFRALQRVTTSPGATTQLNELSLLLEAIARVHNEAVAWLWVRWLFPWVVFRPIQKEITVAFLGAIYRKQARLSLAELKRPFQRVHDPDSLMDYSVVIDMLDTIFFRETPQ